MAQQMITLEEAAERLGISPEEMKKRLKTDPDFKMLSQIRDGSSVRFKLAAIEELARQLGMASDPGLPLAPMKQEEEPGSDDFKVKGADDRKKPARKPDAPLDFGSDDADVFSLADEPPKPATPKSSGKLTPSKPAPQPLSDSSAGSSDSDVRIDGGRPKKSADEAVVPTEEISLDFSGPGSAAIKGGSSAKLSAPKSPSSGKLSASDSGKGKAKPPGGTGSTAGDSSEFELSLDADSDDFELQLNPEAGGDEVDLGTLPKDKDKSGHSSGKRGSASGINLRDPADSGISLEKGKDKNKPAPEQQDSDEFELSLDSSSMSTGSKLGAPNSGKMVLDTDSSSEFELTLDDSGGSSLEQAALGADSQEDVNADKGDIFETDFEIPPMPDESGSEAVALESDTDLEKSDFELAMDDSDVASEDQSASEVVLLEDEEEAAAAPAAKGKPRAKPKGRKGAAPTEEADVDLAEVEQDDEDESASKALKGVKKRRRDEEEEEETVAVGGEPPTKPWGVLPVLFLAPTFLVVALGGIIGYELLNTMWGYQQPRKPAAPLVRGIASTFDMELKDQ